MSFEIAIFKRKTLFNFFLISTFIWFLGFRVIINIFISELIFFSSFLFEESCWNRMSFEERISRIIFWAMFVVNFVDNYWIRTEMLSFLELKWLQDMR